MQFLLQKYTFLSTGQEMMKKKPHSRKTMKVRMADFCRKHMSVYYETVETLKKDEFLSELTLE